MKEGRETDAIFQGLFNFILGKCCCYCLILNILKRTDGAPVSKSENFSAEVSHAFNYSSFKKITVHFLCLRTSKNLLFHNELCKNYSTHKIFHPLIKAGTFLFLMTQLEFYKNLHKKNKNPWVDPVAAGDVSPAGGLKDRIISIFVLAILWLMSKQ